MADEECCSELEENGGNPAEIWVVLIAELEDAGSVALEAVNVISEELLIDPVEDAVPPA